MNPVEWGTKDGPCSLLRFPRLLWFLGLQVRKKMNSLDNERDSVATDMLLNYETIKYFTGEAWELKKYANAVSKSSQDP